MQQAMEEPDPRKPVEGGRDQKSEPVDQETNAVILGAV
jgi:hypothetical protein